MRRAMIAAAMVCGLVGCYQPVAFDIDRPKGVELSPFMLMKGGHDLQYSRLVIREEIDRRDVWYVIETGGKRYQFLDVYRDGRHGSTIIKVGEEDVKP